MVVSRYIKPGKKTKEWSRERAKLKKEYERLGITTCEIRIPGICWINQALGFAHKYKRNDPRCEHTVNGTLLGCNPCHQVIEASRQLTDYYFKKLRPVEPRF